MLGVWTRARKVNVRQEDGSHLPEGKFVLNIMFKVFDLVTSTTSATVLGKFALDAEVLYIGNEDCILSLSCLTENGFLVDTQERCLRNTISGLVITCYNRLIPSVLVLDFDPEQLEDCEILLIIDACERYGRYTTCFASQQVARLPVYKPWSHEIPLQDGQGKIHIGAVHETTWAKDEALQKYLMRTWQQAKSAAHPRQPLYRYCSYARRMDL